MASEKQKIIRWLYRADIPDGEINFDELLERAVAIALSKDAASSTDYVAANAKRIWNFVLAEMQENRKLGVSPIMHSISSTPLRRSTWYPVEAECPVDQLQKYVKLKTRPRMLRAIDSLTHRQYEAAGIFLSRLVGADRVLLTPSGNEGGVDFFARLIHPSYTHLFAGNASPLRIVGQSKKYEGAVTVDRVRDFITTLNDVRHLAVRMAELIPSWFKDSRGPIVGWIISHNGFQSGAEVMANNHGILLSNSLDMAEVCTQSEWLSTFASAQEKADEFVRQVRLELEDGSS